MVRKKFFSFGNTLGAALTLSAAAVLTFTVCGGDSGGGNGGPVGPSDPTGSCTVAGTCNNNVAQSACTGTFVAGGTCGTQVVTGSCTVAGNCTNGVAQTACTGTFVAGQACPVQQTYTHYCGAACTPTSSTSATPPAGCWATLGAGGCVVQGGGTVYYCLADCNPTAPLPANPSPTTCFDNVNTCVLNQGVGQTYTHYCGAACTPTQSTSQTPAAGCWATLGVGGCQVQGGPGPFCCYLGPNAPNGECFPIEAGQALHGGVETDAQCLANSGFLSQTDQTGLLQSQGACDWNWGEQTGDCHLIQPGMNPENPSMTNLAACEAFGRVYSTLEACEAAAGTGFGTIPWCRWGTECHPINYPSATPPLENGVAPTCPPASGDGPRVPCATNLQNCQENSPPRQTFTSEQLCLAWVPATPMVSCFWPFATPYNTGDSCWGNQDATDCTSKSGYVVSNCDPVCGAGVAGCDATGATSAPRTGGW